VVPFCPFDLKCFVLIELTIQNLILPNLEFSHLLVLRIPLCIFKAGCIFFFRLYRAAKLKRVIKAAAKAFMAESI